MGSARILAWSLAAAGLASAAAVGLAGAALSQSRYLPASPAAMTPPVLETRPLPADAPNREVLERGRVLTIMGDCVSCHTRSAGQPMAGGLGMNTPFGVIYTPNITPDADTGIGRWTADQFHRALTRGIDDQGHHLYPAFPYVYFSKISRTDSDAIYAYLKTVPPVRYTPPHNRLPFPFNIRLVNVVWNWMFFRPAVFRPDPARSAEWNRGAYLVSGLGHCGQCHTPTNVLGANQSQKAFQGGDLDNWVAPDLTGNRRTGLGDWSADEVVQYLTQARNRRAQAGGAMAEVVSYSTSLLPPDDVRAIATYLKTLPPSPSLSSPAPDAGAMRRGAAIYSDACASCHLEGGKGQPGYFPPLGGDQVAQQRDPTGLIHLVLAGVRTAPTQSRPSPLSMPSFAWKLTNGEVADVSTYLRNSFGNLAPPVAAGKVAHVRAALGLKTLHLTDTSGDHEPGDTR